MEVHFELLQILYKYILGFNLIHLIFFLSTTVIFLFPRLSFYIIDDKIKIIQTYTAKNLKKKNGFCQCTEYSKMNKS